MRIGSAHASRHDGSRAASPILPASSVASSAVISASATSCAPLHRPTSNLNAALLLQRAPVTAPHLAQPYTAPLEAPGAAAALTDQGRRGRSSAEPRPGAAGGTCGREVERLRAAGAGAAPAGRTLQPSKQLNTQPSQPAAMSSGYYTRSKALTEHKAAGVLPYALHEGSVLVLLGGEPCRTGPRGKASACFGAWSCWWSLPRRLLGKMGVRKSSVERMPDFPIGLNAK